MDFPPREGGNATVYGRQVLHSKWLFTFNLGCGVWVGWGRREGGGRCVGGAGLRQTVHACSHHSPVPLHLGKHSSPRLIYNVSVRLPPSHCQFRFMSRFHLLVKGCSQQWFNPVLISHSNKWPSDFDDPNHNSNQFDVIWN